MIAQVIPARISAFKIFLSLIFPIQELKGVKIEMRLESRIEEWLKKQKDFSIGEKL